MVLRSLLLITLSLIMATAAQAQNMSLPRSPQFPTSDEHCQRVSSQYRQISASLQRQLNQCHASNRKNPGRDVRVGPCAPVYWSERCAPIFEQKSCISKQGHAEFMTCMDRLNKYRSAQREKKKQEEHARRVQNASDMRTRLVEGARYIRANQKSRTDRDKFLDNLNLGLRGIHRAAPGPSIAKRFFDQSMKRINEQFKTNLALLDNAFAGFEADPKMVALKNLTRVNLQIVALLETRRAEKTRRQAEAAAERRRQADLAAERQRQDALAQQRAAQAAAQRRQAEAQARARQQAEWEQQQRFMAETERMRLEDEMARERVQMGPSFTDLLAPAQNMLMQRIQRQQQQQQMMRQQEMMRRRQQQESQQPRGGGGYVEGCTYVSESGRRSNICR